MIVISIEDEGLNETGGRELHINAEEKGKTTSVELRILVDVLCAIDENLKVTQVNIVNRETQEIVDSWSDS